MKKVFLGGTCNDTKWRDEIIPYLPINYFNPVVEDWTPDCIIKEDKEKEIHCDTHLYIITPEMKGIYSIAEIMDSLCQNKIVLVGFLRSDKWDDSMKKSINATIRLIKKRYPNTRCEWISEPKEVIEWMKE